MTRASGTGSSSVQNEIVPVIAEALRQGPGIPLKPDHQACPRHGRRAPFEEQRCRPPLPARARARLPRASGIAAATGSCALSRPWSTTNISFCGCRWRPPRPPQMRRAASTASSVVTAMAFNCRGFALRVSGLGDTWFKGPHAQVEAKLFEGHSEDEITWMGGESIIAETIGLGGFAQASAPCASGLSRRLVRDDDRPQQGALRHHRRREPRLPRSRPWLSRHADRHRHLQGASKARCFLSSISASPERAAARSAPAWCGHRLPASRPRPRPTGSAIGDAGNLERATRRLERDRR